MGYADLAYPAFVLEGAIGELLSIFLKKKKNFDRE